jgi:citrate/tricarballylate utilization protein
MHDAEQMTTSSASTDTTVSSFISKVTWQLEVCNACRYCEGYCAVFPALERRRSFSPGDVQYLANLCFDCRACFYACMYAPPHEFGVNIPQALAQVRRESYKQHALPAVARRIFGEQGRAATLTILATGVFFLIAVALTGDFGRLFGLHVGDGAFYRVVPYVLMFVPALVFSIAALGVLVAGVLRFARQTHGRIRDFFSLSALRRAAEDTFVLRYLHGGGAGGCTYPNERTSMARPIFHQLVMYGFVAALLSTIIAFVQQDVLGWQPPYPLLSWPVILGTLGGVAMIVGSAGLIALKIRSDRAPADGPAIDMDYVFLALLLLVNVSGLLLLALRETIVMGALLVLHLATVFGLFFSIAYGKFAHFLYRYTALVQNQIELARASDDGH